MDLSRREVFERHPEFAANLRLHLLDLARKAVGRQPFGRGICFEEGSVDLLRLGGEHAVQPDSIGFRGVYFRFWLLRHNLAPSWYQDEWPSRDSPPPRLVNLGGPVVSPVPKPDGRRRSSSGQTHKSRIICIITGHRALGFGEIAASYGETIVRQLRCRPCSIDKYLTWESARLDDPWPCAFSTLCASIAEGRYSQVSKDFSA